MNISGIIFHNLIAQQKKQKNIRMPSDWVKVGIFNQEIYVLQNGARKEVRNAFLDLYTKVFLVPLLGDH